MSFSATSSTHGSVARGMRASGSLRLPRTMNDQAPPAPADDKASAGNPNRAFLAIAVVFMAVGVSFLFNPEMTTVGWTFLPVGVVFLALGFAPAPKGGSAERNPADGDGAGGDDDDPTPPASR